MGAIAIVTGASSGLGREFVHLLDAGAFEGIDEIWAVARRADRLDALARTTSLPVRPFCLDLCDPMSFDLIEGALAETPGARVRLVINNAGFGTFGSFREAGRTDASRMCALLVTAPVELMYRTLPYMSAGSRIINIASVAAFTPQPGLAAYSCLLYTSLYAHASNGGIAIGSDAQTEVPGLFACGESTGGMHGADRIGGLSSANGLVFGRIAGASAARWARRREVDGMRPRIEANRPSARGIPIEKGRSGLKRIREIMGACAMVARDEAGLEQAAIALRRVDEERRAAERDTDAAAERAADLRLRAQTLLAQSMILSLIHI